MGVVLCLLSSVVWSSGQRSVADIYAPFLAMTPVSVQSNTDRTHMRQISTLALEDSGRVWVGGYSNLIKFDGARSQVFSARRTPGLVEASIRALLPLPNGDVLVGANREGVLRWRQRSSEFEALPVSGGGFLSRINALSKARDGGVWISAEQGLFYWRGGENDPAVRVQDAVLQGLQSTRVMSALESADGRLYVAAYKGVYVRHKSGEGFRPIALDNRTLSERIAREAAWTLAEDGLGRLWVGLVRSGAVVVDKQGHTFAPAGLDGAQGVHKGSTIRTLLWHDQKMWLGTDGEGLLSCHSDCAQVRTTPVNLRFFEGRRNFHVRKLAVDAKGRIWAASDRGVFHFDPRPKGIFELDITPEGRDPRQQFSEARSVLYDRRGRIWVGMGAGEVMLLDVATGQRRLLRLPAPLSASSVEALQEDRDGKIWASGHGVMWVDPDTLQPHSAGEVGGQAVHRFTDMVVDGDRVWLTHHDGLIEATLDGRVLRRLSGTADSGLATTQLVAVGAREGRVWLGTPLGLHLLDTKSWTAALRQPGGAGLGQVQERYINAVTLQNAGGWIGTSDGLWRLGAGVQWPEPVVGTEGKDVRGVLQLGRETWFTAVPSQIGRVDEAGRVKIYGSFDGVIPANGYARRALVAGPSGTLLVATGVGLLVIDPAALRAHQTPTVDLSPRIVAMSVDGIPYPGDALPDARNGLQLEPDQQRLSIEFATPDYQGLEKQRFAYQLQGYDDSWVEIQEENVALAMFGRVPAGDYRLALRVTYSDFPGREWISYVPVRVKPYWHQLTWVRVLVVLALVALLGAGFWLRDVRTRQRRRSLELLVAQRTEELERANERLDQLAGEDALTGLNNRRRLFQRLNELCAESVRYPRTDTLMLLDFDHFKKINDTYGHQAGDAVLSEAARRIASQLRGQDFAGRYGGEELMVVLPRTTQEDARALVVRVRDALCSTPIDFNGQVIPVTVSIGVAQSLRDEAVDHWVARADKALYQAKADGRDRVRWAPATQLD